MDSAKDEIGNDEEVWNRIMLMILRIGEDGSGFALSIQV